MAGSLFDHLLDPAAASPSSPAVVDGDRALSRAELSRAAERLAGQLVGQGLAPGDTLGCLMPNSIEMVVAVLAGIRLQARLLLLDPGLKPAEVAGICDRASARLLLVPPGAASRSPADSGPPSLPVPTAEELLAPGTPPGGRLSTGDGAADRTSFLFLSSGSTGMPKLVLCSADHLRNVIELLSAPWPHGSGDRMGTVLPLFHVWGLRHMLATALRIGAPIHLLPAAPRQLAAAIARERITILPATPFIFRMLAETDFRAVPDFSSLRLPISGGAPLTRDLVEKFRAKFGADIHHLYGSTEVALALVADPSDWTPSGGWRWRASPGVTVKVVGPDGREVPAGTIGTLAVRSSACASAYLDDPVASAATFRDGMVITGDAGSSDADGRFTLLGREQPMLNIAGKKVAPAEIEACLRLHPAVREARVTGTKTSSGDDSIGALVATQGPVTAQELRDFCAARLATFKVPRDIEFVAARTAGPLGKTHLDARTAGMPPFLPH